MSIIINLSPDQMNSFNKSEETIYLVDPVGNTIGVVSKIPPLTEEEIQAALKAKRAPGPRYTTQEVLDYLNSLEEQEK